MCACLLFFFWKFPSLLSFLSNLKIGEKVAFGAVAFNFAIFLKYSIVSIDKHLTATCVLSTRMYDKKKRALFEWFLPNKTVRSAAYPYQLCLGTTLQQLEDNED